MTNTDLVQIISLPLEVTGLFLTIVENFFNERNKLFEQWFDKSLMRFYTFWKTGSRLSWIFFSVIWGSFAVVIYLIGERETPEIQWQYNALLVIFFGCFYTFIIHRFLIVLLPNRKLLAFAITLSAIGLVGEFYQVIQINF